MAVLTFFLWSHEDSDSYWDFKLSFAICQIAEVAKLMSLITFCQHFCDMEVFFGTLTNSQLFGIISVSVTYITI